MSVLKNLGVKPVDPTKFGVDENLLNLLYQIGILGCVRSYFVNAASIFDGYLAVNPKSERGMLGAGLLALSRPNYDLAIELLEKDLLKAYPNSSFGKAYLGLAYKQVKRYDDAKKMFNEVIQDAAADETAKGLAKAALEQLK